MARRSYRQPSGHNIKVGDEVYALAILAARDAGQPVGAWAEDVLRRELRIIERDRETARYREAHRQAADRLAPTPLRSDYYRVR